MRAGMFRRMVESEKSFLRLCSPPCSPNNHNSTGEISAQVVIFSFSIPGDYLQITDQYLFGRLTTARLDHVLIVWAR